MKQLIMMALLLAVFCLQAQDYLLTRKFVIASEDTARHYEYAYNDDFTLNHYALYYGEELKSTVIYLNDTIVRSGTEDVYRTYHYFDDSVTVYHHYDDTSRLDAIYYLDEEGRCPHFHFINGPLTDVLNTWEGNNIVEQSLVMSGDTSTSIATYYDYINPTYNARKSFRVDFTSCYNQAEAFYYPGDDEPVQYYDVTETIGNYPVKTVIYNYGVYAMEFHHEYMIINNIPAPDEKPGKILSVSYYNLLGQQVNKPKQGFYIESKVTSKGVISTKHYIQ